MAKRQTPVTKFSGLVHFYRWLVRGFADIAKPLTRLTEGGRDIQWKDDCERTFNALKQTLVTAPVLSYTKTNEQIVLDIDVSNVEIDAARKIHRLFQ